MGLSRLVFDFLYRTSKSRESWEEEKKIDQSRRQWRGLSSSTTRKRIRWRWKSEAMDRRSYSCSLTIFSSLYFSASFVSPSSRYWTRESYIGLLWTRKTLSVFIIAIVLWASGILSWSDQTLIVLVCTTFLVCSYVFLWQHISKSSWYIQYIVSFSCVLKERG